MRSKAKDARSSHARIQQRVLLLGLDLRTHAALAAAVERDSQVAWVATLEEGLYRIASFTPNIAVINIETPGVEAAWVLQTLKNRFPTCMVIVTTSIQQASAIRDLTVTPIYGLFLKPFPMHRLVERVRSVLKQRRWGPSVAVHLGPRVGRVIEYLANCRSASPTLEELSSEVGVSISHLTRQFRRNIGLTVKEYQIGTRLNMAKRLLLETDEGLERIAELAGFYDASHLSRTFRERVGLRPGEYRRS